MSEPVRDVQISAARLAAWLRDFRDKNTLVFNDDLARILRYAAPATAEAILDNCGDEKLQRLGKGESHLIRGTNGSTGNPGSCRQYVGRA
jgi:hypothetical protein